MKNRAGSYKKLTIDEQLFNDNFNLILDFFKKIEEYKLKGPDLASCYILFFTRIKHSTNWLQKINHAYPKDHNEPVIQSNLKKITDFEPQFFTFNDWEKNKINSINFYLLFKNFNLKGIPNSVNKTMVNWYLNNWNIIVTKKIPSSKKLLEIQTKNARCITIFSDSKKAQSIVLNGRDPLSFLIHDLMHAEKYFGNPCTTVGQLGFYKLSYKLYSMNSFLKLKKSDPIFKTEIEYVLSDMNAYTIHLLKCFKAAFFRKGNYQVLFYEILKLWNMDENEKMAMTNLNSLHFTNEDEKILLNFFELNAKF